MCFGENPNRLAGQSFRKETVDAAQRSNQPLQQEPRNEKGL